MAILNLSKAPKYEIVRDVAGAVGADNSTISVANYPLTDGIDPGGAVEMAIYWEATGTAAADWLTFELLEAHGPTALETEGGWIRSYQIVKLPPKVKAVFPIGGNNLVFIRVDAVNIAVATDLLVYAARNDIP